MSVDFVNGISPALAAYLNTNWGCRQDTVVHIEGLEGPPHGIRLNDFPMDVPWAQRQKFYTNISRWRADPDGATDGTKFVKEIMSWIEEHFDPRGRLVITGKSTGGVNALQLCRHIARAGNFFKLPPLKDPIFDSEAKGQFVSSSDGTPFTLKVRIDLLCVFDASFDTSGFTRQRTVPNAVRTYANWFQTQDKDGQIHETLNFDSSTTGKIMDQNVNGRIPPRTRGHVYVCKVLGPLESTPIIEADLSTATPSLAANTRGGAR
ncbi:MAG: hypothetical protein HY820_40620 [Acidobacteria bacterium]|nr:hypothetical protein [Acidobacteriota bacterium]